MGLVQEIDGWGLGGAVAARLRGYAEDLLRWGRAQNLVSRRDPEDRVRLLLLEGVRVVQWLGHQPGVRGGPWADVGSGAGFPGLVFACCCPQQPLDLIERRQGRCDFLRRESAALDLREVRVVEGDVREAALRPEGYSLVTLKAVAPPSQALDLARPLLGQDARALLFQRPDWDGVAGWSIESSWRGGEDYTNLGRQAAFLLTPDP